MSAPTRKPIKNARSQADMGQLFARLEQVLTGHGARQIAMEYDDQGLRRSVTFAIPYRGRLLFARLPARIEQAQTVLKRQYDADVGSLRKMGQKAYSYEHAYRVAWRNIVDWVDAQMALVELELVRMEEVFLPYIVDPSGQTFFEAMEQRHFQLETGEEGS